MLKKIGILLAILIGIGAIVGGIAFYKANNEYGLLTASIINHEVVARPETRLRVSIDTIQLGKDLTPYFPDNLPLPSWLPWDMPQLLPKVLPREIALLGGADYANNAFNLTVFMNEQRGGPALTKYLNTQSSFRQAFPAVLWNDAGFVLRERGIVAMEGELPLPYGLEDTILESWTLDAPEDMLTLVGGHVAEGVIDNRNGEIVTLIGGLAPIWDTSLDKLQANSQFAALLTQLAQVFDIRFAVDFENADTVLVQIRIHIAKEFGGQLELLAPLALNGIKQEMMNRYRLTLESENAWNVDEETFVSDLKIIGVEPKLKNYFATMFPAPAPPVPAADAPAADASIDPKN